jgi:hypothetical protein
MTALSAPKSVPRKGDAHLERYAVKGSITVYTGANLVNNGGYVQPAAGLASLKYAGIAREGTVVASATDGAREVDVQVDGRVQMALANATVADIGKEVYMTDDNVITLVPNNGPKMGRIDGYVSAGVVIVNITGYTEAPTGLVHIVVPFVKKATEFDSTYDLPSRMLVEKVYVEVVTAVESSTIDVGTLESESGGDGDGFIDGASCATAGFVDPIRVDATEGNITIGALLKEQNIKSNDGTALYAAIGKDYYAGSLTAKSISYKTSDHAVTGNIHVIGRMI